MEGVFRDSLGNNCIVTFKPKVYCAFYNLFYSSKSTIYNYMVVKLNISIIALSDFDFYIKILTVNSIN